MNSEKNENEKILDALQNRADFTSVEDASEKESNSENFYKIEMNDSLKSAVDKALEKWDVDDKKESQESEGSENQDKVLKTAVEIVMEKTDHLVDKVKKDEENSDRLKTALEIAMNKSDKYVEGDGSAEEETEKKEDSELKPESESEEEKYEPEEVSSEMARVENFRKYYNFPEVDESKKVKSTIALKTWDRWKSFLSKKVNYSRINNAREEMQDLEGEYTKKRDRIEELKKESEELVKNFENKKEGVTDAEVLKLLDKNLNERLAQKEKEAQDAYDQMLELREQYWDSDTELKESTKKINEIESKYSELIDSKINNIREKYSYDELVGVVDVYKEKIIKFSKRLDMVETVLTEMETILDDPEGFSKEDLKELKKRYRRKSKKAIVIAGAVERMTKELDSTYVKINKIIDKINKLQELRN